MRSVLIMAGREFRDGIRNRRVVGTTLLMAALSLTLALLGSAPTGTVGASALSVTVVSLSSLTIFLVPLIALLISYDAIWGGGSWHHAAVAILPCDTLADPCRQIHRPWLYPYTRNHYRLWRCRCGRGHRQRRRRARRRRVFRDDGREQRVARGDLHRARLCHQRGGVDPRTAAGVAIGVWLFFVVLYDMALLGLLIADQGKNITPTVLSAMLLANPADIFRLLNLTGFSNISMLSGMAGLSAQVMLGGTTLVIALVAWIAVPLSAAGLIFARRQI